MSWRRRSRSKRSPRRCWSSGAASVRLSNNLLDFEHINLAQRVMMLIPMLLSLAVHEWAHAWSAYRLGDDTAAMQGRLTLNPLAHVDPIGSFLLPLLVIPFRWAEPG